MVKRHKKNTRKLARKDFWRRHPALRLVAIIALAICIAITFTIVYNRAHTLWRQLRLDPFYDTTGLEIEGNLGEVVRQEPMRRDVSNGTGYRILYRSQKADGSMSFSSGMIFIPNTPAPAEGRRVVAWAHGTVGMGNQCAPSRTPNPLSNLSFVDEMMEQGWVVTATDYSGLGTPGIPQYLVGAAESNDVINSVRAARDISRANASNQYVVWGHSQGGHSALFTGARTAQYAPELELRATVASAPAAELPTLFAEQKNLAADWTIGPEVAVAWPTANPSLNVDDILTTGGKYRYKTIAEKCIVDAALDGLVLKEFNQKFFSNEIQDVPSWNAESIKQTAPTLAPSQPLLVSESTTDNVVLPNTTALYIQRACKAGSNLTQLWLTDVSHMEIAEASGPATIGWIADRFQGIPNQSNCNEPSPVAPATPAN